MKFNMGYIKIYTKAEELILITICRRTINTYCEKHRNLSIQQTNGVISNIN